MVHRRGRPRLRLHRQGHRPLHPQGRVLTRSSVVVVSNRPGEHLARCLASVAGQADEVIVVDNASAGAEASSIGASAGALALRLRKNVGFAAGVNAGIRRASGDLLALLNDDAVAGAGWIETAAGQLEDSTVAAVAPKIVLSGRYLEVRLDDEPWQAPGDARLLGRRLTSATLGAKDVLASMVGDGVYGLETARDLESGSASRLETGSGPGQALAARAGEPGRWRWTAGRLPFYLPVPDGTGDLELRLNGEVVRPARVVDLLNSAGCYLRSDGYVGDIGSDLPNQERFDVGEERFAVSGAAFVTTREALSKVGRFAGRYFAYYEDADWCWRARLMGLRIIYDPAASVRHDRGSTSGGLLARRVRFLAERNRILTLLRNAPLGLAARATWEKAFGGGDDGVARVLAKMVPRALLERGVMRRDWALSSREVFDRWAGVDVPAR